MTEYSTLRRKIEAYAKERGIKLKSGWKVELAKSFKKTLFGKKKKNVPDEYLEMWVDLFKKLEN